MCSNFYKFTLQRYIKFVINPNFNVIIFRFASKKYLSNIKNICFANYNLQHYTY